MLNFSVLLVLTLSQVKREVHVCIIKELKQYTALLQRAQNILL